MAADGFRRESGPFSIIPEWVLDAEISDRAIRLYAVLCRYANDQTGECFPARSTLAKRLGCSANTIDRARAELEEIGALTREQRTDGRGGQTSNLYTLRWSRPMGGEAIPTAGEGPLPMGVAQNESHIERGRNEHFDALVELFGPASTPGRAAFYGKISNALKRAGASPEEILRRGRRMLAKGWTDAGPAALEKHWDALSADQPPRMPPARPRRDDPRRP